MATWGDTSTGDTNVSLENHVRASSGQFNVAGQKLDSVHIYCQTAFNCRAALYEAATNEPNGATLVEDLGAALLTALAWNTFTSATNPALTSGKYYFIVAKSNDAAGGQIRADSTPNLDLTTVWVGIVPSTDDAVAYTTPAIDDTATLAWSYCMYITYSAAASTGGALTGPGGLVGAGGIAGNGGILCRSREVLQTIIRPRLIVPVGISLQGA